MAADFSLLKGASRVIMIDSNWRLDYIKEKYPRVETIDFSTLPRGTSVYTKLRELVPRGPDVALECGMFTRHPDFRTLHPRNKRFNIIF